MLKLGLKIGHSLILLVTGLALIGVNVKQLYCCHAEDTYWEVQVLPTGTDCPCEEDCCGEKGCHSQARHDFYKITAFSRIETGIELIVFPLYMPVAVLKKILCQPAGLQEYVLFRHQIPDQSFPREILCTYLC